MKADPSLTSHATAHDVDVWRIGRGRHDERARSKVTSSRAEADRVAHAASLSSCPQGLDQLQPPARPPRGRSGSRRATRRRLVATAGHQRRAVSLGPDRDIEQFGSATLADCCDDAAGKVGPLRHGLRRPRFRLPGPMGAEVEPAPSRSAVYRALRRADLIDPRGQAPAGSAVQGLGARPPRPHHTVEQLAWGERDRRELSAAGRDRRAKGGNDLVHQEVGIAERLRCSRLSHSLGAVGYAFTRSPYAADHSIAAMTSWRRTPSAKSGTV